MIAKIRIIFILLIVVSTSTIADEITLPSERETNEPPVADDIVHQDEFIGVLNGIVKECNSEGPAISNVGIYIAGTEEQIAITEQGQFTVFLPGGYYDLEFRHEDFQSRTLLDVQVYYHNSPQSEIPIETFLFIPEIGLSPNSLSMSYNPGHEPLVHGYFDLINYSCGEIIYSIEILIIEPATQGDVFLVYPQEGTLPAGEEQSIRITFHPDNDPDFELPFLEPVVFYAVVSGPYSDEAYLYGEIMIGNPSPDVIASEEILHQNSPNPFNPSTTIQFDLKKAQDVTLTVFNLMGQEVAKLVDGEMGVGQHSINFDGSHLASGIYFYRIETPEFTDMKKMVIMK